MSKFFKLFSAIALLFLALNGSVKGMLSVRAVDQPRSLVQTREQSRASAASHSSDTINPATSGLASPEALDWTQVQRDPQHSGYSPESLGTHFPVAWTHPFQPEKVFPQVQAIVYAGRVFVGTEMGNLYAFNAQTGAQAWINHIGSSILNSVAAADGKVFFGAMDGAVYALDANTGSQVWKNQLSNRLGFSTAPVLADGKVMLGGRNGIFYGLDPATGNIIWQYPVGAPILQTAAWNNGRAFFGSMDMFVYAINTTNGSLAWKSQKINGAGFIDYWPVIVNGYVIIRPIGNDSYRSGITAGFPFTWYTDNSSWQWLIQNGPTIAQGRLTSIPDAMNAQAAVMADYTANPGKYIQNLYILNETNGNDAMLVPHWSNQIMHGTATPPCIDRNGLLVVPIFLGRSGWGRLDLSQQRITDILYDNKDSNGGPMAVGDTPAGMGNRDETLNVTCAANSILSMHTEELNANYTGVFDLDHRLWTKINPGSTSRQMSTNTQGGGGNPAAISNGMLFHISFYELIARAIQP